MSFSCYYYQSKVQPCVLRRCLYKAVAPTMPDKMVALKCDEVHTGWQASTAFIDGTATAAPSDTACTPSFPPLRPWLSLQGAAGTLLPSLLAAAAAVLAMLF
jgi:hypothetical protein